MKVYLAINPDTRVVVASDEPITDNPDWPRREAEVQKALWGKHDDRMTADWWDKARPDGAPMWPLLP